MKKIFIEDGLSLYNKTGIGQYTENLSGLLSELGYKVIMPRKPFLDKIKNASLKRILYVLWLNIVFPFLLLASGSKIVIFSNYLTPLYKIPTKKYYPVIHDLSVLKFPETMSKTKRNYQAWILKVAKNNYHKIITVSESVKKEIADYYKCSENDICTIYNYFSFGENVCMPEKVQNNILNRYNLEEKQYILSVGSLNKRKNIQALIDAYNQINISKKLVIAGRKENQEICNENTNVIFTGYIDDEDLKILYKNALIFIFPSLYEGFGIPLIDAQSFGVPVLCSDIPVFHEVGGDSVEYCGINPESIKEKLSYLTNDETKQKYLVKKGYENIERFFKENLKSQIKATLGE